MDEIDVEFLPAVIGGRGTPALFDSPPLGSGESPVELRLISTEVVDDGRVRMRYEVAAGVRRGRERRLSARI